MMYRQYLLLSLVFIPVLSQALSFHSDTIFLDAQTKPECSTQGGSWTEWYGQTYCTKPPESFPNIVPLHPHILAINYVKKAGIVKGYPDGEFRPNQNVNRAELLKILIEAVPRDYPQCFQAYHYSDAESGAWYERYLQTASCSNIVQGYPDGTFKPGNPVSLAEAAKMISLTFEHKIKANNGPWYEPFIENLANKKALPITLIGLEAYLTRGQLAEIVYRLKQNITTQSSHTLESLQP